ncbi:MAG: hypothetical protein RTU30_10580, partial [Candidatus Thorarchaeota archaeon]
GTRDIAAYSGTHLYLLSNRQDPPTPPLPAEETMSLESQIAQLIASGSLIGLPAVVVLGVIVVHVRRKEIE